MSTNEYPLTLKKNNVIIKSFMSGNYLIMWWKSSRMPYTLDEALRSKNYTIELSGVNITNDWLSVEIK
jgi:hypothetical protein